MSYGRVHNVFWEDEKIEQLSDRAIIMALFLISGSHRNAIGCFRLGLGAITDLPRFKAWGSEGASKALTELVEMGFITRDEQSGWTFIRNALKHDPISNRNAAVGAAKIAAAIPTNIAAYQQLREKLEPQLDEHLKGLAKVAGYPMRPASKPVARAYEAPSKDLRTPEPQPEPEQDPQPRPDAAGQEGASKGLGANGSGGSYADLRERIERRLNSPSITNFNRIRAWLDEGADPELDIMPAIEAGLKKLGKPPATLKWFDGFVADAKAARTAPMPSGKSTEPKQPRMVQRHEARDALKAVGLFDEPTRKEDFADWRQKREAHLRSVGIDPRSLLS